MDLVHLAQVYFAQAFLARHLLFASVSSGEMSSSSTPNLANPWGKLQDSKKARTRYEIESPYTPLLDKDMQNDEDELVPTCPPDEPFSPQGRELVTMDGIANLLKQQLGPLTAHINRLSANVETLDAKYGNINLAMEQRLEKMESQVDGTKERIEKLENFVHQMKENTTNVDKMIKEQVETYVREKKPNMEQSSRNNVDKKMLTAVIGNLDGLGSLAAAQTWLKEKLSTLNGPKPTNIYVKGAFQGMLFAEFPDQFTRDLAVTLLKTADVKRDGKDIWVAQDRNPVERAARNFCFGLKHLFKNEWDIPYTVRITDGAPYTLTVGGELALTAHVSNNEVVHEWHGEWASWDELHASAEVKLLLEKSNALVLRAKEGLKGKGASKGAK